MQFLPDIVRLQRLLMDRFHRRIDRTDAENFQIREFLQSLPRGRVFHFRGYFFLALKKKCHLYEARDRHLVIGFYRELSFGDLKTRFIWSTLPIDLL